MEGNKSVGGWNMGVKRCSAKSGILGICGHVGIGHVHSHSGFVQDDSGGFAVAASLLKKALPVDSTLSEARADLGEGMITVTTADGGEGRARARRGITPVEAELIRRVIGKDSVCCQSTAFHAFGRIYGQGVLEAPVALESAIALALVDTFKKKWPSEIEVVDEDMPGKAGKILGSVLEIESVPVSLLAVVNASEGGIGPDEDLEGNVLLGAKGALMKQLGLHTAPTIVIEGKPFVPGVCDGLKEDTFWIRANRQSDNTTVAACLTEAAGELKLPYLSSETAFPRGGGALTEATRKLGQRIVEIGNQLASSETSCEKVKLVGELAVLISEDAGGATFMTNSLQDVVGSAGMVPGTSAVISLLVTPEYIKHWKIPVLTSEDCDHFLAVITKSIPKLSKRIEEARQELKEKCNFRETDFGFLFNKR
jgi:hypothetical protein